MRDFEVSSGVISVRELQAVLFPVQPIPGGALGGSELPQLQRFELPKRDLETTLFSVPLSVNKRESKEAFRALLGARCIANDITREAARWPTECQVISERIRHIEYNPSSPEPFYVTTGREPRPKPVGDEFGTVLFKYCPTSVTNYFSRSCVGGSSTGFTVESSNSPKDIDGNLYFLAEGSEDNDLRFESRFESGNLGKVVKITDTYYQLYLRRDLYTQRHTQWFYFRISNTRSKTTYRLSIVNLCKEESLYNEGLRPLLYSVEDARTNSVGWRRCGENITYYKNGDSSSDEEKERHTLTFNLSFPHDRDVVYLAHCYPYTYTDLQEYLSKIVADPIKTRYTKLRLLCRTLAGNNVYYLTITAPTYHEETKRKRGVVITARVHPGETPSSWTMKGIIDFLTGDSSQARELRERFVFKLVPMLNPDGVIVGNNRCSLSGKDLNRQYRTVMRESYPSVWHTKLMIRRLLEECGIAIYCDLHAHSRKHNVFAYGCESKRGTGCTARLSEQVFPLMLHKNAADKFSFENCKFHVEKGKEGTGRVVVWLMGVQNSYTMEASMGGSKIGSRSGTHFSTQDYEQIGRAFCETLLDFSDEDPVKERLRTKIIARLTKEGSNAEEPTNIELTDYSSDEGDTSSSSSQAEKPVSTDSCEEDEEDYRYLVVPPPTPTFVPPGSVGLLKRRLRRTGMQRNYLNRRRLLARRTAMDLPTTDPGSDLCDFTDSDDGLIREKPDEMNGKEEIAERVAKYLQSEEIIELSETERDIKKKEVSTEFLMLPSILRPRSVSLGENLLVLKNMRKAGRSRCSSRVLRHQSPVSATNRDLQFKLTSLRQQIWMGLPIRERDNFTKMPLSWGVSSLALTRYHDEESILKSPIAKPNSSDYESRIDPRKTRRKSRKKQLNGITELPLVSMDTENPHQPDKQPIKKKRSRLNWQRVLNLNSKAKDNAPRNTSLKTDSLKLLTIPAPPQQRRPRFESTGIRKNTNPIPKTRKSQAAEVLCETSSSDDGSSDSNKHKSKRKQKKKRSQRKKGAPVAIKKRGSSARTLRRREET